MQEEFRRRIIEYTRILDVNQCPIPYVEIEDKLPVRLIVRSILVRRKQRAALLPKPIPRKRIRPEVEMEDFPVVN